MPRLWMVVLLLLLEPWAVRAQPLTPPGRPLGPLAAPVPVVLQHPLVRGLVGWWRVNPPWVGGPRLVNLVSAAAAQLTGATWTRATRLGSDGAITIPTAAAFLQIPQYGAINNLAAYTMMCWINPASFGGGEKGYIFQKSATGGITIGMLNSTPGTQGIRVLQDTDTTGGYWYASNVITLGSWQHITVVYNRAALTTPPALYVNGIPVTVTTDATPTGTVSDDSGNDLYLGHDVSGNDGRTFDGAMDDWQIWNRLLSAAEVLQAYRLSRQGWPGVLRRQTDLLALGAASAPTGGGKGRFFPLLWPEQRK